MLTANNLLNTNTVLFGKGKEKKNLGKRGYTAEEKLLRHEMNTAAMKLGWRDVYTGKKFTKGNPPSAEHLIPFSLRKTLSLPEGFEINGLDNLFPVGRKGNNLREDERFAETVLKQPIILDRLLAEMTNYEKYNSPSINGKDWVKRLRNTILTELKGLCSDVATRKISIKR